ncbi:MAG: hypothetical protein ABIL09_26805, partial [Gemmatimonadota bacterium]
WAIESQNQPDWRSSGAWWVLDMGSIFRIHRLVWLPIVNGYSPLHYGYARDKTGRWKLFDFLFSDGTPDNEANPFVEGSYDYQLLSSVDNCGEDANKNCTRAGQSYFDFQFPAQSMRYLMWRRMSDEQLSKALQVWVFHAEGYPAQVEFESADMDLGGARSIAAVEWDADAPPGTRIEVLTQTGNGYATVTRYYDAAGREVTKDAWELLKARQQGPVVEDKARDGSWSSWSEPHRVSGERFLSPTPRRWMRVRVRLISEDPDLFPSLRALSFVAAEPVINAGVSGVILPREAALDSLQEFTYTLSPVAFGAQDPGFDRILVMVPPEAGEATVTSLRIASRTVAPGGAELRGDSLLVSLPSVVRRDSVEISFTTRVFRNPTVFDAYVYNSRRPDEVQGVVPAQSGTDQVFVPEVFEGGTFFRNLAYSGVFTPNRDGINDELVVTFNYVRAARAPAVAIYRLDGALVATLAPTTPLTGRARYVWAGDGADGSPVPPGTYLMRLRAETDAADESVVRLVHVAY